MPAVQDFPDIDSVEQIEWLTWDASVFLPPGVILTNANLIITDENGIDNNAQAKATELQLNAVTGAPANTAIAVKFGVGVAGAWYLFIASGDRSDGGVWVAYNHVRCNAPA